MRRIQYAHRDGVPLDWIAFLGIEALKTNLPRLAAEQAFWPTIFAITVHEEISTAFVVDDEHASFVAQHAQDMDYVLRFARDRNQRTVDVEKSPDLPASGYPTLVLDLEQGRLAPPPLAAGAQATAKPDSRRAQRRKSGPSRTR